ncbi:MAG: hypothetical protein ABIH67_00860 [Candidatus Uhrbacteria bacterium]
MPAPNLPLCRRDYKILILAQNVGQKLRQPKSIPYGLIHQIFQHVLYIDPGPAIRRLFDQGFMVWINPRVSVRIPSLTKYDKQLLFGDDDTIWPDISTTKIAENWRNKEADIFCRTSAKDTESEAKTKAAAQKQKEYYARILAREKAGQQALARIDIDQVLADHRVKQNKFGGSLPTDISQNVIARKRGQNKASATYIHKVLQKQGLLRWKYWFSADKKNKQRRWYVAKPEQENKEIP